MGIEITLSLNGIDVDWGKNRYWKGHHGLFPPGSLAIIEYRYADDVRGVDGISKKVLTDTFRALERDGMITRTAPSGGHPRYELTDLGRTLHDPLQALQDWAESHVEDVLAAQDRYDTAMDEQTLAR